MLGILISTSLIRQARYVSGRFNYKFNYRSIIMEERHSTDKEALKLLKGCEKIEISYPLIKSILTSKGFSDLKEYKGINIHPMDCEKYNYSFSRTYLTYLTQRMLGFMRIPCCEEKLLTPNDKDTVKALASLSESEIDEHIKALRIVYDHTQRELKRVLKTDALKVYRGFRSESMSLMITLAKESAIEKGESEAEIFTNTIDFFSVAHDGGFSRYGASISIDVPIENILLCHHTIKGFSETDSDVFVISRAPNGFMKLPIENIIPAKFDGLFDISEVYNVYKKRVKKNNEIDHVSIFRDLFKPIAWEPYSKKLFYYMPGFFENKLSLLGRFFDKFFRKPERSYKVTQV